MPAAEKRKTPAGQPKGAQKEQQDFMAATSPVAAPQVAQNEPMAAPVPTMQPQAFQASPAEFTAPDQMLVPGAELAPEEMQALFGQSVNPEPLNPEVDWAAWMPLLEAVAGESPALRAILEKAKRLGSE